MLAELKHTMINSASQLHTVERRRDEVEPDPPAIAETSLVHDLSPSTKGLISIFDSNLRDRMVWLTIVARESGNDSMAAVGGHGSTAVGDNGSMAAVGYSTSTMSYLPVYLENRRWYFTFDQPRCVDVAVLMCMRARVSSGFKLVLHGENAPFCTLVLQIRCQIGTTEAKADEADMTRTVIVQYLIHKVSDSQVAIQLWVDPVHLHGLPRRQSLASLIECQSICYAN